jgi:hypothetical protein
MEAQGSRVVQVLERGRVALAGGTERALPTTFAISGRKTLAGSAGKSYAVEIYAQLPDKFVWKEDEIVRGVTTRRGFDGNRLITDVPQDLAHSIPTGDGVTPAERADVVRDVDQLKIVRAQFSALTLGLFATSLRSVPLTFADVQGGETANAIGVTGRDGFGATLVFDRTTGLPAWLGYQEFFQRGMVARRWVYEDYRNVEGRMVPHQLKWMTSHKEDGPLLENAAYTITSYRFDLPIDSKVFKK